MNMEGMGNTPMNGKEDKSLREIINQRLQQIKDEVAPDYQIPESLWNQMVIALEKGTPASGGAFSKEELADFNDETRMRLGNYLAEATRGIAPGKAGILYDSTGTVIGKVESKKDAGDKSQVERGM